MLQLLFALAFVWLATISWRGNTPVSKAAALSAGLIAAANLLQSPLWPSALELSNSHALTIMVDNAARYIALPLSALILIHQARQWHWLAATWGRIFLGLAAMFEIGRRGDFNDSYLWLLESLWGSALLLVVLLYGQAFSRSQRMLMLVAGLYTGAQLYMAMQGYAEIALIGIYTSIFVVLLSLFKPRRGHA